MTLTELVGYVQECAGAKLFLTGVHEADCVWARSSARLERQNSNVEAHMTDLRNLLVEGSNPSGPTISRIFIELS